MRDVVGAAAGEALAEERLPHVAPAGVAVGMALSYAMLRAWGFASGAVGLAAPRGTNPAI